MYRRSCREYEGLTSYLARMANFSGILGAAPRFSLELSSRKVPVVSSHQLVLQEFLATYSSFLRHLFPYEN